MFKPFVYLAAFEHAQPKGAPTSRRPPSCWDEPTTFTFNEQTWSPGNYDGEYDGPITLRRALALSRNIAAVKVAESAGYDDVAALWRRVGAGTPPRPYPSIALGVFEATPFEIATAYTLFPNGGTIRPLRAISRLVGGGPGPADPGAAARNRRAAGHDLPRDQHDAQRAQRGHRRAARAPPASRSTPPASPARPTTCATPGSSASRRSC